MAQEAGVRACGSSVVCPSHVARARRARHRPLRPAAGAGRRPRRTPIGHRASCEQLLQPAHCGDGGPLDVRRTPINSTKEPSNNLCDHSFKPFKMILILMIFLAIHDKTILDHVLILALITIKTKNKHPSIKTFVIRVGKYQCSCCKFLHSGSGKIVHRQRLFLYAQKLYFTRVQTIVY